MGGIGKTTLVRAVFNRLMAQFEAFYFAKDVRQQLERNRLDELQEKCLKELLKDEGIGIYNLRSTFVKKMLHRKKILLVLDDVDNSIAIDDLIKACNWFGEGSRIIITSRDMQVLKNISALTTYHVPKLDPPHALHLFSLKAFKKNKPSKSYLELSKRVVDYCKGNPFDLTVLGCFLDGRSKKEWDSALEKLNQALHKDIFNVLKLSFDGLDDLQKNVFLDLVFFLNRTWSISLDHARDLYGSSTDIEISVLKERSLILMGKYDHIDMHALLMEMGLEISRQQLIHNLEKPIRLWRHQDIDHVFNNDKGIEAIRCLSLDASQIKRTTLIANFRKMHDLIFLTVYKLNICEDLDYLPEGLRFFSWQEYPLSSVPSHFPAKNLIVLRMPNSNIKQFCDGNQHFPNLEEVILSNSQHLVAVPELSHAPKIKFMDIEGCVNLAQIGSSTMPKTGYQLFIDGSGPVQINIGGGVERTRLGLVIVYNCLDLEKLSFNKLTTKLFVSGKIFFSVQVKHVGMPLVEKAELKAGIQSLKSLLPFVKTVEWLESPIELGDDFNQHCTYSYDDWATRKEWDDEEEEYDESTEDEEEVDDELIMEYCCCHSATLMEDEEEDQDDELIMECCCSNSADIFTRVPNSITRWSLLTELRLKESDIIGNNATGSTIAQLSILKPLVPLSYDNYWTRVQRRLDLKFSSDPQTSASLRHYIWITYTLDINQGPSFYPDIFYLHCIDHRIWIMSRNLGSSPFPLFAMNFLWKLG